MRMRTISLCVAVGVLILACVDGHAVEPPVQKPAPLPPTRSVQAVYQTEVRPLLQKYCYQCHANGKAKGDVRLEKLSIDFVKGPAADLETWHDVLENLHRGEMPPKNQPRPTAKEHGVIVDWLNRAFVEARQQREGA